MAQGSIAPASALQWREILDNLGRASAALDAYAGALAHYLYACEQAGVEAQAAPNGAYRL